MKFHRILPLTKVILGVKRCFNWVLETIKRNQDTKEFEVLPKQWIAYPLSFEFLNRLSNAVLV